MAIRAVGHGEELRSLEQHPAPVLSLLRVPAMILAVASLLMFFGMSINPAVYDEGITVTGAMRLLAGQIPHRDFYAIYGPAHFYLLAGCFKLFGESLFTERLLFAFISGLIVAVVFLIASFYCNRSITIVTTLTVALWLFGFGSVSGAAMYTVSLLNLAGTVILLPAFLGRISIQRALAAGALAGLSTLFRYDTGIGMLGIQACILAFAAFLRADNLSRSLRLFIVGFWPILAGFAVLTVPPALYYLSVAPFHYFYFDIIYFPSKFYARGRRFPFPGITLRTLDNLAVYLPIAIAAIALYRGVLGCLHLRNKSTSTLANTSDNMRVNAFLVGFGFLALIMYLKGIVRVSPAQMYLAILPSLLLIAVLFQHRDSFHPALATCVKILMLLEILTPARISVRQVMNFHRHHQFVVPEMLAVARGRLDPVEMSWCHSVNPLTRGICFLPSDDRIQAIEFIDSHTTPNQTLFVGNTRHDKILVNDNILYFATQRLPATHWSHFDPLLQNRYDIQTQMVHEFDSNQPPYIILESEFDSIQEPNESVKSSGVTLLDDYLHSKYRRVETFGQLSIWQRIPTS